MKVERLKTEEKQEKEIVSEIAKHVNANTIIDKVTDITQPIQQNLTSCLDSGKGRDWKPDSAVETTNAREKSCRKGAQRPGGAIKTRS